MGSKGPNWQRKQHKQEQLCVCREPLRGAGAELSGPLPGGGGGGWGYVSARSQFREHEESALGGERMRTAFRGLASPEHAYCGPASQ